jgi:hypothetical protein
MIFLISKIKMAVVYWSGICRLFCFNGKSINNYDKLYTKNKSHVVLREFAK